MLYAIEWFGNVLKYGIQYKCTDNTYGDRLYSQIGKMPGWENGILQRQAGQDIIPIIERAEQKWPLGRLHKDSVEIEIMDYTDYPFERPEDIYREMQNFEEAAKLEYFKINFEFPIGNIRQERIKPVPMFSSLFE